MRELPQNILAERAVLGGLLLGRGTFQDVVGCLGKEDFQVEAHRHIWSAMRWLSEQGHKLSVHGVLGVLQDRGKVQAAKGEVYLLSLADLSLASVDLATDAKMIRRRSVDRQVLAALAASTEAIHEGVPDSLEVVASLAESTLNLESTEKSALSAKVVAEGAFARMEATREGADRGGHRVGVKTGFRLLDDRLHHGLGMMPQDLNVLAARPRIGKTSLALNIAVTAAKAGHAVLFQSLEMSEHDLMLRILSSLSAIPAQLLAQADLSERQWGDVIQATAAAGQLPLWLDPSPGNAYQLAERARRHERRHSLDLLIVDHLHEIQRTRSQARLDDCRFLDGATKYLKVCAKINDWRILLLAQCNRDAEDRPPRLSNVRGSGAIEQVADSVTFVHREDPDEGTTSDLLLRKNRHGPAGATTLGWAGDRYTFRDLASHEVPKPEEEEQEWPL